MNTIRNNILQVVREFFASATGTHPDKVIPAQDNGTAPAFPYYTVELVSITLSGQPETLYRVDNEGNDFSVQRAQYSANVQVNGYGPGVMNGLAYAIAKAWDQEESMKREVGIVPMGAVQDGTTLVDKVRFAEQARAEFTVTCAVETAPQPYLAAQQFNLAMSQDTKPKTLEYEVTVP